MSIKEQFKKYIELLQNPICRLPGYIPTNILEDSKFHDIKDEHYFPKFTNKYGDVVKTYLKEQCFLNGISANFCTNFDNLQSGIDLYFKGDIYNANIKFYEIFDNLRAKLLKLTPNVTSKSISEEKYYYRARSSEDGINQFTAKEQYYHPPFESRYKLNSYRYSAPGVPCLYLGTSCYICWVELNRPNINNFYFTQYILKTGTKLKIIDLSWRPINFAIFMEKNYIDSDKLILQEAIERMGDYIKCWPLLYFCSLPVPYEDKNNSFKPQYIISQALIQWIIAEKSEVDGLKFFSSKVKYSEDIDNNRLLQKSSRLYKNLVIPIKNCVEKDYNMEVLNYFDIKNPFSYMNHIINNSVARFAGPTNNPNEVDVEFEEGFKHNYAHSIFGQLEQNYFEKIEIKNKKK